MKTWLIIILGLTASVAGREYSTCASWDELIQGKNLFGILNRVVIQVRLGKRELPGKIVLAGFPEP